MTEQQPQTVETEKETKRTNCDLCGIKNLSMSSFYRHRKTKRHLSKIQKENNIKMNNINLFKPNETNNKTSLLFLEKIKNDIKNFLDNNI